MPASITPLPVRLRLRAALLGLLSATLVVLGLGAPAAQAGVYKVWSCGTPDGRATSHENWAGNSNMIFSTPGNGCDSGGHLGAFFMGPEGHQHSGGMGVRWQFTAPPSTSIEGFTFNRSQNLVAGSDFRAGAGVGVYRGDFLYDGAHVVSQCLTSYGCVGVTNDRVGFSAGGETRFGFDASCYGPPSPDPAYCTGSNAGRATISARAFEINLIDTVSPTAANPGGTILDAGPRSGEESVTFQASDQGGGVWQAEVKLGDRIVTPRTLIDANGGRCTEVDVDRKVNNEFGYPVPCKTGPVTANLAIPTGLVTNGTYLLTVTVWDVAQNSTTVVSRRVTIDNGAAGEPGAGGPNGSGGALSSGALSLSGKKKAYSTHYGGKIDLKGQLLDAAGTPIAGAQLDVFETLGVSGAAKAAVGKLTTGPQGEFSFRPTTRASRTIEFAYPERLGLTTYRSVLAVPVSVRAAISLKLARRAARPGQLTRFSGKVRVDPLPQKGVRVAIEYKARKGWQPAANRRTGKNGRFTWSHRFRTRGPYQFRARILSSGDLAARPATTPIKRFRVR